MKIEHNIQTQQQQQQYIDANTLNNINGMNNLNNINNNGVNLFGTSYKQTNSPAKYNGKHVSIESNESQHLRINLNMYEASYSNNDVLPDAYEPCLNDDDSKSQYNNIPPSSVPNQSSTFHNIHRPIPLLKKGNSIDCVFNKNNNNNGCKNNNINCNKKRWNNKEENKLNMVHSYLTSVKGLKGKILWQTVANEMNNIRSISAYKARFLKIQANKSKIINIKKENNNNNIDEDIDMDVVMEPHPKHKGCSVIVID
mmetsp:Transcript_12194/g.15221  ORF Transcript_12194/g.15221 Transcript_12194/m.15221 type:complete len:255 (+) Transcript_12194:643-1407(+)